MKINKPNIYRCEPKKIEEIYQDNDDIYGGLFEQNVEGEILIKGIEIHCCIFKNINFNNIKLDGVDLIDVEFEGCDLSHQIFSEQSICRVVFRDCKMFGTQFIGAFFNDVVFYQCSTKYLNFSGASICKMLVENSDFTEATFMETKLKNILLCKVKLERAEFIYTSLNHVDLSTCDITHIVSDVDSLKGVIIDRFQAQDIVHLFGVKMK